MTKLFFGFDKTKIEFIQLFLESHFFVATFFSPKSDEICSKKSGLGDLTLKNQQ